MKVCGFTIVRNAVQLDYPVVEAIRSILPVCDEVIVAVGQSEDPTLDLIRSIDSDKIRIIETVWDDSQRQGGRTLALETDKALAAVPADADWCFYIQADEVLPEQFHDVVRSAMHANLADKKVEGLLFEYKHFYGSYDYVGSSWSWYRREIRVVRNDKNIFSYRDAQGFRKRPNEKLNVRLIPATMYHYGWVRDPRAMQRKQKAFSHFYHDDQWIQSNLLKSEAFDYSQIDSLERFKGVHPLVMQERINRVNWKFDHDLSRNTLTLRERLKRLASAIFGYRIGEYRNYRIVGK
ncbi:MAG TPA: glycosyltransferase family 2 protein [Cyclobacteriaceae bacterium]|nr:glycosyltransferase family 2 protein [Cyclobacteriaceae bacterium]